MRRWWIYGYAKCKGIYIYIQVRKHSSSLYLAEWGPRALMTTPIERAILEWRR